MTIQAVGGRLNDLQRFMPVGPTIFAKIVMFVDGVCTVPAGTQVRGRRLGYDRRISQQADSISSLIESPQAGSLIRLDPERLDEEMQCLAAHVAPAKCSGDNWFQLLALDHLIVWMVFPRIAMQVIGQDLSYRTVMYVTLLCASHEC